MGSHSTLAKKVFFFCIVGLGRYTMPQLIKLGVLIINGIIIANSYAIGLCCVECGYCKTISYK